MVRNNLKQDLKEILKIRDDGEELLKKVRAIAERKNLGPEQSKAAIEAEDGLRFWLRTHLAILRKEAGDEEWQYP